MKKFLYLMSFLFCICGIILFFTNAKFIQNTFSSEITPSTQAANEKAMVMRNALYPTLPPEANGKITIKPLTSNTNQYIILCKFTLNDTSADAKLRMQTICRDFIFTTYKTALENKIDIVASTVFIRCPDDRVGLTVGLGQKIAAKFEADYWSQPNDSPADFMLWLQENKHNAVDAFHKCTYGGIYAKKE